MANYSQQWIAAGDFNAWPGAWEIANMIGAFYDAWASAPSLLARRTRFQAMKLATRATAGSTTSSTRTARRGCF